MSRKSLASQLEQATAREPEDLHTLPPVLERRPEADDAGPRKRPRYPSEENRTKATYDLSLEIIEGLRDIAVQERLGRRPSRVAQALLVHGVEMYEAGRIEFEVRQRGPNWWLVVVEK